MSSGVDTGQQYCLKWNNHQTSISSTFSDLLASDSFVDVTLSCEGGKVVRAHRLLLSACSPYFRHLLSGLTVWQHPVIVLRDVTYQDLAGIVQFIYHGEVSIDQDCLPGFLAAAESLGIKGLTGQAKAGEGISGQTNNLQKQPSDGKLSQETVPLKTKLIKAALEKLVNGPHTVTEYEDQSALPACSPPMEEEEEEEAMSDGEMQEKGLEFQAMYQSFMSGGTSEDSEGSKELSRESGHLSLLDPNHGMGGVGDGGKKTCPFCLQQLSWHALSRHIRDMHRAKTDLVTCQYCRKTFRNKNSLGCHIWRFHKRGKELIGKEHVFDGN